jgi:hypothetical protein
LRPSASDGAEGSETLLTFLNDVVIHLASTLTQDRRGRYWESAIFDETPIGRQTAWLPSFPKPPADVRVLLGYVRGRNHLTWIHSTGKYNLRADNRTGSVDLASSELSADLVLLYGTGPDSPELWEVSGRPELWTRDQMVASSYPRDPGRLYLCLPLKTKWAGLPTALSDPKMIEKIRQTVHPGIGPGYPATCTLADLLAGA